MDPSTVTPIVLLILMSVTVETFHYNNTDLEGNLIRHLLDNYESRSRPAKALGEAVMVELDLHMQTLDHIDTKGQLISIIGFMAVSWSDWRLAWNKTEFGDLDHIALHPTDVWLPSFVMGNTAAPHLFKLEWYTVNKVQLFADGSMYWSPGGTFEANCVIDVKYFPFDDQICDFMFQNWIYTGDLVNLTYTVPGRSLLDFYQGQNSQWDIMDVKTIRYDKYYVSPKPYPEVHFGIHVRRKPLYYIMNIILLSVLLALLVLLVFKLPPESGERISMGVTLLLSFSIFILMIDSSIPQTSVNVPVIIIYLFLFMALTSLAIMESVLVLYFYHHTGHTRPPRWIRILIFDVIGRCLCLDIKRNRMGSEMVDVSHYVTDQGNSIATSVETVSNRGYNDSSYVVKRSESTGDTAKHKQDMDLKENRSNCLNESNTAEWKNIAKLVDYFCFRLFLSLFVLLIAILLVIIPQTQPVKDINNTLEWAGVTIE